MWRRFAVSLLFTVLAAAQAGLTLEQLSSFIRSSIKLQQRDKEVAAYLRKQKLSFSLSDAAIEEFQRTGAGPQTITALRELQKTSRSLPAPPAGPVLTLPAKPVEPAPSEEDLKRIIEQAREYALSYTKHLHDFICLQLTRRFVDPSGAGTSWLKYDEIKTRLSYFEQHEDYKLISVNEKLTNRSYESLGGAISTGEFGSVLLQLFTLETAAEFQWDRHSALNGRKVWVFRFRVPRERSQWHLTYGEKRERDIIAGYSGLVYIDKESGMVLRISSVSEEVPADFPIREARSALDYGFTKIANRDFLLPLHATTRMRQDNNLLARNEVEFRLYRKFSAEASIAFDNADLDAKPSDDKPPTEPPEERP